MAAKSQRFFDWASILSYNRALEDTEGDVSLPPLYEVLLIADESTSDISLFEVLEIFFHVHKQEGSPIVSSVKKEGQVVCGLYTRDVAETKVIQVISHARDHNHPLRCLMQKEQKNVITQS